MIVKVSVGKRSFDNENEGMRNVLHARYVDKSASIKHSSEQYSKKHKRAGTTNNRISKAPIPFEAENTT